MQIHITPDYLLAQGFLPNFADRFWSKVQITDSCWLWTGSTNQDGYGIMGGIPLGHGKMKNVSAHKASWLLHRGLIPVGKVLRHKCPVKPNPACVNYEHLMLGTKKQNAEDAAQLLRDAGQPHWNSRLTIPEIEEIRRLSALGITNVAIAKLFEISAAHVSRLKHFSRHPYVSTDLVDGSGWEI